MRPHTLSCAELSVVPHYACPSGVRSHAAPPAQAAHTDAHTHALTSTELSVVPHYACLSDVSSHADPPQEVPTPSGRSAEEAASFPGVWCMGVCVCLVASVSDGWLFRWVVHGFVCLFGCQCVKWMVVQMGGAFVCVPVWLPVC